MECAGPPSPESIYDMAGNVVAHLLPRGPTTITTTITWIQVWEMSQMNHPESQAKDLPSFSEDMFLDQLLNRMVILWTAIAVVAFALTQIRALELGWTARDLVFLILLICILAITFGRRKLGAHLKAIIIIVTTLTVGAVGICTLGMLAGGVFFLPFAGIIISLFYSKRALALYWVSSTVFLCLVATGFASGYLKVTNSDFLLASYEHWSVYIMGFEFVVLATGLIIVNYREAMGDLMTRVSQQRDELRKAKSYIANIIDSMPSMLVSVDPDGVVTGWNMKAERITGMPAEQAVGQKLTSVVPRLALAMDRVREAIRSRRELTVTKKAIQHGRETRYEDVTIYPLIANGVYGAVIRIDDVTDQVRVEEMMVRSEKMLSVGGLAAGMAHEVNNPLAGMIQTAAVMSTRLTDADLEANRRAAAEAGITMQALRSYMQARGIIGMLDRIRDAGTRAAAIVTNMQSFARKSDHSRSSHDLAELLDQAVDLAGSDYDLKKMYDFRQIEIVRDYDQRLPLMSCEKSRIQQVFLNILRNGAEAMHGAARDGQRDKPRFVLRLRHEKAAGRVRIEIEDNGPGMDEEVRRRVFEPFFTTKDVGAGTGLGLSVSYFIVTESYEGEIAVESQPGSGSKFVISLPLQRSKAAAGG